MQQRLKQFWQWLRRQLAAWWLARVEESRHCSDCGGDVSPWDTVCPGCGLANPARVHISPQVYAGLGVTVGAVVAVMLWV